MTQRTSLLLAVALTAFVLLVAATALTRLSVSPATSIARAASAVPGPGVPPATPARTAASITPDVATAIARAAVPGAGPLGAPELVDAQGRVAYEVSLDRGKVYVDAATGAVLASPAAAPSSQPAISAGGQHDDSGEGRSFAETGKSREGGHDD